MSTEPNPIPANGVLKTSEDSFDKKKGYTDFNSYDKSYVVLTSDRLILNSKEDSIFLSSKRTIGLSAVEQVHINIGPLGKRDPDKHFLVVNSPRIQLGLPVGDKNENNEPIAKAHSTIDFVNDLIEALNNFCNSLSPAKGIGVGTVGLPEINAAASTLRSKLNQIKGEYGNKTTSPIPSKVSKTL
jgi:hypothetical protein